MVTMRSASPTAARRCRRRRGRPATPPPPRPPRRRPASVSEARGHCTVARSRVELSAGVAQVVHDAAGTAWSCQPDSASRQRQEQDGRVAGADDAGRAQRAVRRHLGGRRDPGGGHVDAADGEAGVVLDQRGERGRRRRVGQQRGQGRARPARPSRAAARAGRPGPPPRAPRPGRRRSGRARRRPRGRRAPAPRARPARPSGSRPARRGRASSASSKARSASTLHSVSSTVRTPLTQLVLLVGEGEVHRPPPSARGSPSRRSATTLRWISLVPA